MRSETQEAVARQQQQKQFEVDTDSADGNIIYVMGKKDGYAF